MAGREEIEKIQLERLRAVLGAIRKGNRFYRGKIESAGLDENVVGLEEFKSVMPFTDKADLARDREEHPPYGSNLTFPVEEYCRFTQSSGTTSVPLAFLDTRESWSAMLDCWDIKFDAARVGKSDVIFFAFSFGPFLGFWTAFEAAARRGNLAIPGGGLSSLARLQAIVDYHATVLCCTPTYALRLGELFQKEIAGSGCGLPVRKIIVAGEPGGSIPETRNRIEDLWRGARVFDHHGMTETGPVSYEHWDHPLSLCVMEGAYLAEVIDVESLREVAPGETGELVLTTLVRTASPLLRYRTGDLVRKAFVREDDGSEVLKLEGGILGRVDEMVVVRGVNIYPAAIEKIIRGFDEVAEYQVVQSTRDCMAELAIVIEPQQGVAHAEELAKRVKRAVGNAFSLRVPVSLAPVGALPRYEFKSKRWIRK